MLVIGLTAPAILIAAIPFLERLPYPFQTVLPIALTLGVLAATVYVLWHQDPAWLLSGGLVLSTFSGNWDTLGFPSGFSPDRGMLLMGVAVVLMRGPAMRTRPPIRPGPAHFALAAAALYVIGSAIAAGTLLEQQSLFRMFDRFTILGFVVFLVAPFAFRT